MIVWQISVLLLAFLSHILPFDIADVALDMHHMCLKKLHFQGQLKEIYKALVCGKRIYGHELKNLFIQGGLIHLTVVSGAHLLFLERFWEKLPIPVIIKKHGLFIILTLYALISNLQAPVLRALFSVCLLSVSKKYKLFWQKNFITFLSALLCLIYQPAWIHSLSLQLSMLACCLLNFSIHSIKKSFFVYLFILPIINRWQALHPLTVIVNWILAPIISGLLFPLSFLSPLLKILYPITDFLWLIVLKFLKYFSLLPSSSYLMTWYLPKAWIWPYVALVHFLLFYINNFKKMSLKPRK